MQKISFYTGKLAGEPVVVTQSGVGKTLAAMSTTLLLEHFDVDGVINIGTAGGLLENQEVLDVVISTRIAHHDVNVPGWNHGFGPDNPCCFSADERYIQAVGEVIQEQTGPGSGRWLPATASSIRLEQVERIPARLSAGLVGRNGGGLDGSGVRALRRTVCRRSLFVGYHAQGRQ